MELPALYLIGFLAVFLLFLIHAGACSLRSPWVIACLKGLPPSTGGLPLQGKVSLLPLFSYIIFVFEFGSLLDSLQAQSPEVKEQQEVIKLPPMLREVGDLRIVLAVNPPVEFTFNELKSITDNFKEYVLGIGGFGFVYRGFMPDHVMEGLQPRQVAVKVHDSVNSFQGHKEWKAEVELLGELSHPNLVKLIGLCCEDEHRVLVYELMAKGSVESHLFSTSCSSVYTYDFNAKLSDFGLAKNGPVGDTTHVSTRIMGTYGYAAPEYLMTGHLTTMSDVYSYGVVLLELLTGKRSLDKSQPLGQHALAEWTVPYLTQKRRVLSIIDPRLGKNYPEKAVQRVAWVAYHCISHNPKARPLMRDIVDSLERLQVAV